MLDVVFVVLVYRNTQDLIDFFHHFNLSNCRVIVVNSYYDDESDKEVRDIANKFDADFLSVPNKGYGAGNNAGCRYAMENYQFKYLVISNADVMLERFDINYLEKYDDCIVAPKIINLRRKNQNPSTPFTPSHLKEEFKYWLYNGNHSILIWFYYMLSRLEKCLFYCICFCRKAIFSAHGAFVIFPASVLRKLYPLYDERMFLFNEEEHLGRLSISKEIKTLYAPEIKIRHKEDGSMKIGNVNIFEQMKKSYLVYYDNWIANAK